MNHYEAWMCRMSGRSWWECMYANGDTLAEWGTLVNTLLTPFGRGASSRWETVSKHQMTRLRLICPNGMIGELVSPWHDGAKFFQFKVAIRSVGREKSHTRAQVIGLVLNPEGDAKCYAWETPRYEIFEGPDGSPPRKVELAPARLIDFDDNVFAFTYENVGRLSLDIQGLKL
jgi:hypothetical protein